MKKANIAVLVSGGGTNLQAILDAYGSGTISHGRVVLVVSNNPGAYALERARAAGIRAEVCSKKLLGTQQDCEGAMTALFEEAGVDLIVLAGFLSILSAEFTQRWKGRIINIHPSLIPSFCGAGCYGLKVHEMALARGVKITGATVHYVNEVPDGGTIIAQKAVEVMDGDTPEVLQRRVMEQAEWVIFPMAVEKVCSQIIKEDR
ncbi:MAG: phosphoribosylglycinamide formyltransferase [Oscillospiraceae bacterium]|nr:phosphoribosylglycinamide formyltransferase [Oscillospiraceae bacterium]